MSKIVKKMLVAILTLSLAIIPICSVSASAAVPENEIMPLYNNVNTATANLGVSDSGKLTINYKYTGFSGVTTRAVITTYIEKQTLWLFWTRVDIGTTNDEWVDTIYDYRYTGSRTFQLPSTGTYRVTVNFKIYGSGGAADEIEKDIKFTY
ncbi:MAG: hypothetical protein IJO86_03775 [Oscillospiraceae bacterium]|nr:hypothetical protein [Oscillospiraceae bacterium]